MIKHDTDFVVFEHATHGEINLPLAFLEGQPRTGACDDWVDSWYTSVNWKSCGMTDEQIRAELLEYGAWEDSELKNIVTNRKRMMWIAAGNWQDDHA